MKKTMSKIIALIVVMAMLAGMVYTVSAVEDTVYTLPATSDGPVTPGVTTGDTFTVEMVLNIASFGEWGNLKLVVGKNASGKEIGFEIGNGYYAICEYQNAGLGGAAYVGEAVWSNLGNLNEDLPIKLEVAGSTWKVYLNGNEVLSRTDDKLIATADSAFFTSAYNVTHSIKTLKITKPADGGNQGGDDVVYELSAPSNGPVTPNVVTGDTFTVDMVLNISSFDQYGNVKLVVGKNASGKEIGFQIGDGYYGIMEYQNPGFGGEGYDHVNWSALCNTNEDVSIKLEVAGSTWKIYVGGSEVMSHTDDKFLATADSVFLTSAYNTNYTIKSLVITKPAGSGNQGGDDVVYELSAPVDGAVAPGVTTGTEFVAETVINATAFGEWGNLKLMVGENASGNRIWLEFGSSGVIAVEEVGSNSSWVGSTDVFKLADYFGEDVSVKLEVAGKDWKVTVNGSELLSCSDDRLCPTADSVFAVDAYNTVYTVKSLKITKAVGAGGEVVPPPVDPGYEGGLGDAGEATVLYELAEAANGPVEPGIVTGSQYKVDMIVNVSEFTNDYGSVQFNVGTNANGRVVRFVINKAGLWAETYNNDVAEDTLGVKYNVFNWTKNVGKDVRVTLEVDGTTWMCYINDALVWAHGDDKMLVTEESVFSTRHWEASYAIKELRLTELEANEEDALSVNGEILYQSNVAVSDSVIPGVMTRDKYEVAMKILFNRLKPSPDENMRGVKLVIGQTAEYSSDIELWIGVDKVRLNDGGWDNATGINTDIDVDLSALHGTVAIVKLVVDGSQINLYINGTEVASFNEEGLAPSAWSQFSMNQWDSSFTVLSMVIADGTISEGGEVTPPTEGGNEDPAPETGDGFQTVVVALMATAAMACGIVLSQKKRLF